MGGMRGLLRAAVTGFRRGGVGLAPARAYLSQLMAACVHIGALALPHPFLTAPALQRRGKSRMNELELLLYFKTVAADQKAKTPKPKSL